MQTFATLLHTHTVPFMFLYMLHLNERYHTCHFSPSKNGKKTHEKYEIRKNLNAQFQIRPSLLYKARWLDCAENQNKPHVKATNSRATLNGALCKRCSTISKTSCPCLKQGINSRKSRDEIRWGFRLLGGPEFLKYSPQMFAPCHRNKWDVNHMTWTDFISLFFHKIVLCHAL